MKKDIKINPIGLKGREINERMKELMGIQPINENKSNVVIELTKLGPDGNAYAIVRENHEWYIKRAYKTTGLVAEDFKYIGGLVNKKDEAYPSYAKAIKHLNLKFRSLAEAFNYEGEINVFENDNLISERIAGYSEMKGNGFSGKGNLEGNEELFEAEEIEEEIEMSQAEKAVDEMLQTEVRGPWSYNKNSGDDTINHNADEDDNDDELKGKQQKLDVDKDGEIESSDLSTSKNKKKVEEGKYSIDEALKNIDNLIDNLTEGLKKKV